MLCLALAIGAGHAVADNSSGPASRPSATQLRRWVAQLGDDDPHIREQAHDTLLGLDREDLPSLREAVVADRPLLSAQIDALHDIVRHVYLSSEPYFEDHASGFLGLGQPDAEQLDTFDMGIVVEQRMPGFPAYRLLRTGDVLVKIIDHPKVDMHRWLSFVNAIRAMPAGQVLPLRVLRNGKIIDVSIVLQPRPWDIQGLGEAWLLPRLARAETYWNAQFAGILQESISSTPLQP
jgi:hypothetical protein